MFTFEYTTRSRARHFPPDETGRGSRPVSTECFRWYQRDGAAAATLVAALCVGALRSFWAFAVFAGAAVVLELSSSFVTMGRRSSRRSAGVGFGAEPTLRFMPS